MVWCVCMCKSHRDAIWGSPSRFCPLAQFALRMQKPGPRAVSVLGLGICAALFPQVASLAVPLPPMGVSGLTRLRVTDNKGGFPPGPVPMGSREPGTLGRAAQQASQSRYFNCRAPPPPGPRASPRMAGGPGWEKQRWFHPGLLQVSLPWSPGVCVLATTTLAGRHAMSLSLV